MKRCLALILVFSFFVVPVYAQSNAEKAFWDALGMNPPETTESSSEHYLTGYQDGYDAGFKAGFESAMEQLKNVQVLNSANLDSHTLIEQTPPINGHIFLYPEENRVAPLTIKTTGDEYYYFVLTKIGSTKKMMSFFGHGGETIRVKVPLGAYKLYFATGKTWYGIDDLFGEDTVYRKCDSTFSFTDNYESYSGWTVTLYPVVDGNMDTVTVSETDFPK